MPLIRDLSHLAVPNSGLKDNILTGHPLLLHYSNSERGLR